MIFNSHGFSLEKLSNDKGGDFGSLSHSMKLGLPSTKERRDSFSEPLVLHEIKIEFRTIRNIARGTELTFGKIKLDDIFSSHFGEFIIAAISQLYDREGINQEPRPSGFKFTHYNYALRGESKGRLDSLVENLRKFVKSDDKDGWYRLPAEFDSEFERRFYDLRLRKTNKYLLILPSVYVHTLRWKEESRDSYDALQSILSEGFKNSRGNSFNPNVMLKVSKEHLCNAGYHNYDEDSKRGGITAGDSYSIEMILQDICNDPDSRVSGGSNIRVPSNPFPEVTALYSSPKKIVSVNILLNASSPDEINSKCRFYREEIVKKYGVPVRFFRLEEEKETPWWKWATVRLT